MTITRVGIIGNDGRVKAIWSVSPDGKTFTRPAEPPKDLLFSPENVTKFTIGDNHETFFMVRTSQGDYQT